MRYDPDRGPQLEQWRTLTEDEQIELVGMWHRKNREDTMRAGELL